MLCVDEQKKIQPNSPCRSLLGGVSTSLAASDVSMTAKICVVECVHPQMADDSRRNVFIVP